MNVALAQPTAQNSATANYNKVGNALVYVRYEVTAKFPRERIEIKASL